MPLLGKDVCCVGECLHASHSYVLRDTLGVSVISEHWAAGTNSDVNEGDAVHKQECRSA